MRHATFAAVAFALLSATPAFAIAKLDDPAVSSFSGLDLSQRAQLRPEAANLPAAVDGVPGLANLPAAVNGVPEPATWAMMIAGFAFVGAAARRRVRARA